MRRLFGNLSNFEKLAGILYLSQINENATALPCPAEIALIKPPFFETGSK